MEQKLAWLRPSRVSGSLMGLDRMAQRVGQLAIRRGGGFR